MFKVKEGIELFGNAYLRHPTGNYGSVEIDGGATGSWEGYSIGGRAVFMHDNSTGTGLYNDVNNHWLFRGVHGGASYLYYNGTEQLSAQNGYALANNQMRAPIFYDSNNTAYYANPASTSNLNLVKAVNLSHAETHRPSVNWGAAGNSTGAIVIGLPGTASQYDMVNIELMVYEYNGSAGSKIIISGHNWTTGWANSNVQVIGAYDKAVYLARDANKYYIQLGDTTSLWQYGTVHVVRATTASYYNVTDWSTGWTIDQVTTEPSYLQKSANWVNGNYTLQTGGIIFSPQSVRSPIFYDSNNTAYYVDPASSSESAVFRGSIRMEQGNTCTKGIELNSVKDSTWPFEFTTNDVGNDNSSGFWVGSNGYPDMRLRRENGTVRARISSWERSYTNFGFTDTQDIRSPIFYDNNDTGYYVNPASTSNMNIVNANAFGSDQNSVGKILFPDGASYNGSGTVTGAIKIRLPVLWKNTMLKMKISVFDYSGSESFDVMAGGYNYTGGHWVNTSAYIVGDPKVDRNFTVRFGHDGTYSCVWIGETTSTWSYPKVAVTEVVAGHSNGNLATYDAGWNISFETAFNTVNSTHGAIQVGRIGNAWYDSDNTGYYANPASTNRLARVHADEASIATASNTSGYALDMGDSIHMHNNDINYVNQLHFQDNVRFYDDGNDNYLNFKWGDTGAGGIRLRDGDGAIQGTLYGDGSGRCGLLDNDGSWAVRVQKGTAPLELSCDGNAEFKVYTSYTYSPGSSRAPIFYDSGNTAYYLDPASTSIVNAVKFFGDFYHDTDNRDNGMYGSYDSTKTDHIWSMGTSYRNSSTGANFGNLYGLAYKHTNNATGGTMAGGHQMVWCQNGTGYAAMGSNIWTSGNVTAYSDIRVKTNLEVIPNALEKVKQLNGYTFDRTDVKYDEDGEPLVPIRQTGVVAQEVLKVLPEAVTGDEENHYSVAYGNMVGLLIEAIKEQQQQINELKSEIESLKGN